MPLFIAQSKPKDVGTTIVQIPSVLVGSYTYNGSPQGPIITGLDTTHCTVSNATKTDAGDYTCTISLKDPTTMVWKDLTKADKTYNYSINKAAGTVTVSKDSITLNTENLTDAFTVSNVTGDITITSSDTTVATVSPSSLTTSGGTVTVSNVNETSGSVTVTVSVEATTNYEATSAMVSVSCEFIPALEDATWEQIANVGAEGTGANYWSVGDTKTIILNGTVGTLSLSNKSVKVFIIDFNYRGDNGIYFQGFKSTGATPVDIALCDSYYGTYQIDGSKYFNMNHWGESSAPYSTSFGGWKGCDLRYDILGSTNTQPSGYGATPTTSRVGYDATSAAKTSPVSNTLIAALPNDLRSALAPWTIYTDNTGNVSYSNSSVVTTSVDYLPLLAEYEVHGVRTGANGSEYTDNKQRQMVYYSNGNSKVKYNHSNTSSAITWWVRSAYYGGNGAFCYVSNQGDGTNYFSRDSRGLAPAFRVARKAGIPSWSTGTDAEIAQTIQDYYDGKLTLADIQSVWSIGDERTVHLDAMAATGVYDSHVAQDVTMVIMNWGGKKLASDGTTDVLAVVGQKNFLANGTTGEVGGIKSSNTNVGGWDSCERRTWCNSVYKAAIPSTFRALFKQFDNKTSAGNQSSAIVTSTDYFALPSVVEVYGTTSAVYVNEGTQFAYYVDSTHRIKYVGDSGYTGIWWLRSPNTNNTTSFRIVDSSGGTTHAGASNLYGLAPFGCI